MATVTIVTRKVTGVWRGYLKLLDKYPLRMQAMTTCLMMGTGDCIAQLACERRSILKYEVTRTCRFLGCGLLVFGPTMHLWYGWLDKVVKGSTKVKVMKKVGADQLFFLPAYLGVFLCLMAVLRREKAEDIKYHLKRDYWPCLKASYEIWPAVQVANFYLIPTHHRVLVINIVGLMWNTYVAYKIEKKT